MSIKQETQKSHPAKSKARYAEKPSEPVLVVENLSMAFGGQVVLNDISVCLKRGEIVLLRGENGSGKTTLLNILTGNLQPDTGMITINANGNRDKFSFPRSWWNKLNPGDHFTPERVSCTGIGRSWQEVRLFSTQSLRDNIAMASPRQTGENPITALILPLATYRRNKVNQKHADELLADFGLERERGIFRR